MLQSSEGVAPEICGHCEEEDGGQDDTILEDTPQPEDHFEGWLDWLGLRKPARGWSEMLVVSEIK